MEVLLGDYTLNQQTFVEIQFSLNQSISAGDSLKFMYGSTPLMFNKDLIECQLFSRNGLSTNQLLVDSKKQGFFAKIQIIQQDTKSSSIKKGNMIFQFVATTNCEVQASFILDFEYQGEVSLEAWSKSCELYLNQTLFQTNVCMENAIIFQQKTFNQFYCELIEIKCDINNYDNKQFYPDILIQDEELLQLQKIILEEIIAFYLSKVGKFTINLLKVEKTLQRKQQLGMQR
ncbi:UNKNOWN [Stylonychia lemnae]|uniref:Uncharacterized protein n=1 Tax=Stylonychia lemnae TaxID=5949 RepID=A0A077ZWW2_STYLE|nr:UNKNOWN [Stylonychia lemnae]|eukprot:CDW74406.1 UNKNOWN [Stylonychia lemnae]